jgi:hypothetical protein
MSWSELMFGNEHVPSPEQSPLQPAKIKPLSGVAVKVGESPGL